MAGKQLPGDTYAQLIAAGFNPQAAVTMTAIAGGESGYQVDALGDVTIQTDQWGPSYGLYQIRTLKSDTGRGTIRDIQWLAQSPANQAKAAYEISAHGDNFNPWTIYRTGAWRSFLTAAQAAAAGAGTVATTSVDWLTSSDTVQRAIAGVRSLSVEALFVGLGLVLVGAGVARATAPIGRRALGAINKAKSKVAGAVL